jgi:hypothetical protein
MKEKIIQILQDAEAPLDRCNAIVDNDNTYSKIADEIIKLFEK